MDNIFNWPCSIVIQVVQSLHNLYMIKWNYIVESLQKCTCTQVYEIFHMRMHLKIATDQ